MGHRHGYRDVTIVGKLSGGEMMPDEPEAGKIYKLFAGPGEPCIAAGNTWEESVADPAEDTKKKEEDDRA